MWRDRDRLERMGFKATTTDLETWDAFNAQDGAFLTEGAPSKIASQNLAG